ncbi:MAG: sigma-54-dependent Fis family transcriptional regulator [Spirochaetales bacterium]|nr:sigma-54-dependent Fis family transcriptional regulator [Spirochaetales bacterium]
MAGILIIDDEINIIKSFMALLSADHEVYSAANSRKAMEHLHENRIDFVFLDYSLAGENGLDVLKEIKKVQPDLYVVMISGHGDFEVIIQAMAIGAYDYLEKPLDIDKIQMLLKRAMKSKKLSNVVSFITEEQKNTYSLNRIIGKSESIQDIFKQIGLLLNQDVTVLITGENGTGKELVARTLHYSSSRKEEPFVAVNCSGLTESLLDNELFGHEKQAFTGADSRVKGKFETAGEGTIFLDEIGEMPLSFQVKFLRVLQEREFHRLGGSRSIKLKARIITATNVDLEKEVETGGFRRDLFYRVNVTRIKLPSLRERKEDIPLLLDHFVKEANIKINRKIAGASEAVIGKLEEYDWPGNIRELENTITNMCINTHGSIIRSSSIPDYIMTKKRDIEGTALLDTFVSHYLEENEGQENLLPGIFSDVEQKMIDLLIEKFGNNKTRIASVLGISRVTLAKKMNKSDL